ncbi:MAG TPA: hypothetical protein VHY79_00660 [Rhizomicrobium sp.]|jgi:RNA polymerase primary sigma factor|nr:hypothetical protein [Rhizomicrobium sp.]
MRGRPGTGRGSKSAKKSTRSKTARVRTGRAAAKKAKSPAKKKATRKTAAAPARKKLTAKRSTARKSVAKKTSAKRSVKRTPRPARKEVFGEGKSTASREFRDQQTDFVRRNRNRIESLGEETEAALEGDEGPEPEEAEEEAGSRGHSEDDER